MEKRASALFFFCAYRRIKKQFNRYFRRQYLLHSMKEMNRPDIGEIIVTIFNVIYIGAFTYLMFYLVTAIFGA